MLLDPVKVTQPTIVDIYPGRSNAKPFSAAEAAAWNNFILTAPTASQTRTLYNQGRNDTYAWVRDTFPRSVISQLALDSAYALTT
jgi:hypothetical protein